MRRKTNKLLLLLALLLLSALLLSGCRFAVIETGSVRIEPSARLPER